MKRMLASLLFAALFGAVAVAGGNAWAHGGFGGGPGSMTGPGAMGQGMTGQGMTGPGMMGPGMMGPGMMGFGMGPGMMGFGMVAGHPALAELPAEKRERLERLQLEVMQSMATRHGEMHAAMLGVMNAMRAYPVDEEQVRERFQRLNATHSAMQEAMLRFTGEAQAILGEETWQRLQQTPASMAPGMGQGMNPGMMQQGGSGMSGNR